MKIITVSELLGLISIVLGLLIVPIYFWDNGSLLLTEPKFKVGDCITGKPIVGEFITEESEWFYLIKKIGKKSYLTEVYVRDVLTSKVMLVSENSEERIGITDRNSQVTNSFNCQIEE